MKTKSIFVNAKKNNIKRHYPKRSVIAGYFIETVRDKVGCPRLLRGDAGTENSSVRQMQQFLRRNSQDAFAGERSFREGSSQSNQRIEFCMVGHSEETLLPVLDELV